MLNYLYGELENDSNWDDNDTSGGEDMSTATAREILLGYKAYSGGKLLTGTMPDRGAVSQMLNAGENYTIEEGYHNGSGKIIAKDLESQTQATATADNITQGITAWVNGKLITGNGKDNETHYQEGTTGISKITLTFRVTSYWSGQGTGSGNHTWTFVKNEQGVWEASAIGINHGGTSNTLELVSIVVE